MGDAEEQSGISSFTIFLDENHCRNPHLLKALDEAGIQCEKHLDHFSPGLEDIKWLPIVAQNGWCLLTTDARIRTNEVERRAVRDHGLRMYYFSRNNLGGSEMGDALRRALPRMRELAAIQHPPFTASITRRGEVSLRDTFETVTDS